jgi:hypothetical protein
MNNSKAISTVTAMTILETVDLAPALKLTAVRENEPANVRQTHCPAYFVSCQNITGI